MGGGAAAAVPPVLPVCAINKAMRTQQKREATAEMHDPAAGGAGMLQGRLHATPEHNHTIAAAAPPPSRIHASKRNSSTE